MTLNYVYSVLLNSQKHFSNSLLVYKACSRLSLNDNLTTLLHLSNHLSCFSVSANILDGYFYKFASRPTGWTHVVLNYLGPHDGQGIRIYYNGTEVARDTTKATRSFSAGDGRIVVGRFNTDRDNNYASLQVDELIFFNQKVSAYELFSTYN